MNYFLNWLTESSSNITIGYKELEKSFKLAKEEFEISFERRNAEIRSFNEQQFFQQVMQNASNYPMIAKLISALKSKNIHYIADQHRKFSNWCNELPYQEAPKLRSVSRIIWIYLDWLEKENLDPQTVNQTIQDTIKKSLAETQINMQLIKKMIEDAINRSGKWQGSPVHIEALPPTDGKYNLIESAESAYISVGTNSASFVLFHNEQGQFEIDDIIEGDEPDIFDSPQFHSDYFTLINEIKKPGSTSKGKILTLYTARPKKDRDQYMHAQFLPVNIFLSDRYDHVEGLSVEYGEERDIWKVRIDSKYLTQTLDGKVKYYQVTVPNAPVVSMMLL